MPTKTLKPIGPGRATATVHDLKVVDAAQGITEQIVNVSGVRDAHGDVVIPGASAWGFDTLPKPKGVWSHDWDTWIATTIEAEEWYPGDKRLPGDLLKAKQGATKVTSQFVMGTDIGEQAFKTVQAFGDQCEWSVGYEVYAAMAWGANIDDESDAAKLAVEICEKYGIDYDGWKNGDAFTRGIVWWIVKEYSPVLYGASPGTRALSAKALAKAGVPILGAPDPMKVQIDMTPIEAALAKTLERAEHIVAFTARKTGRVDAPKASKVWGLIENSWEDIQSELCGAALVWARANWSMAPYVWAYVEATDNSTVIIDVTVETATSYEESYWQLDWTLDEATDSVTLSNPRQVEPEITMVPVAGGDLAIVGEAGMMSARLHDLEKSIAWVAGDKEGRTFSTSNASQLRAAYDALGGLVEQLGDATDVVDDPDKTGEQDDDTTVATASDDDELELMRLAMASAEALEALEV